MAFSQPLSESTTGIQVAVFCQLCNNDQKLKWKCLECGLRMCQRCRERFHPDIASAQNHQIIDMTEISERESEQEPRPYLAGITCEIHGEQQYCLYCEMCKELVCQNCITDSHETHKLLYICDKYNIKLEKIKEGKRSIEKEVETLLEDKQKLKQVKSKEQSNYGKVKQEILDYDRALVKEIKKHTAKLLKDLDQKWETFLNNVEHEEKKLMKELKQNNHITELINKLIHKSNAKEVFSFSESLSKSMEIKVPPIKTLFPGIPKFIHEDFSNIKSLLGNWEDEINLYNNEFQLESEYETDLTQITNVVSCHNESLWIGDSNANKLQWVRPNGNNLDVIKKLEVKVTNAAILNSDDFLFSCEGSSNLKLIKSGSTEIKDSVYSVFPLEGDGVHVTHENEVIVAAVNGLKQIIVMDEKGDHKNVFQNDSLGNPLFNAPYRVASNKDSIAVVDLFSDDWKGRVVVLDQNGEVRKIYTGHPDFNNEDNPFKPTCIKTTPLDNFVVTDYVNHTLHILNGIGDFVTFYNIEDMGILLPLSLSFSTTGQLYIGCGTYPNEETEEKAKLFIVNNFLV